MPTDLKKKQSIEGKNKCLCSTGHSDVHEHKSICVFSMFLWTFVVFVPGS